MVNLKHRLLLAFLGICVIMLGLPLLLHFTAGKLGLYDSLDLIARALGYSTPAARAVELVADFIRHPLKFLPWRQAFRLLEMFLLLPGLLVLAGIITCRLYFRYRRQQSLRTVEIQLSRDDCAEPFEVMTWLDSAYGILLTRYFGLLVGQDHAVWEIAREEGGAIRFYLSAPGRALAQLTARLQGTYQNIRFLPAPRWASLYRQKEQYHLARPWFYPLKSLRNYQSSLTEAIVSVLDAARGPAVLQFVLRPMPLSFARRVKQAQERFEREHLARRQQDQADPGVGYVQDKELKSSLELTGKGIFNVEIRLTAGDPGVSRGIAGALLEASAENRLLPPGLGERLALLVAGGAWGRWFRERMPAPGGFRRCILSSFHLATLIHLPSGRIRVPGLNRAPVRRAVAPLVVPRDPSAALLEDEYGAVSLREEDRKYNIVVLGGQGAGKSTVLENVMRLDARDPAKAVILLDPNNDLAEKALALVPPEREVIYLNLADPACPWAANPFAHYESKDVLVSNVLNSFKQVWGKEAIGPRSEELLGNAIYALLEQPETVTFYHVYRLLSDEGYRRQVTGALRDEHQRLYWNFTFAAMEENRRFLEEVLAAPRNKLNRLLSVGLVRRALTGPASIDLGTVMARRQVLIVNLAKGALGEENAGLLGVFLLNMAWQAMQAQVARAAGERVPVSLIIDEAHNFLCPALEKILAEGRKFGAQSTLALQFLGQLRDPVLRAAVENLAQNVFLFRTEQLADAEYFSKLFMRLYASTIQVTDEAQDRLNFAPDDILNLPTHHAICRLVVRGEPASPFVARTVDTRPFLRPEWRETHLARQQSLLARLPAAPRPAQAPSETGGAEAPGLLPPLERLARVLGGREELQALLRREGFTEAEALPVAERVLEGLAEGRVGKPAAFFAAALRKSRKGV